MRRVAGSFFNRLVHERIESPNPLIEPTHEFKTLVASASLLIGILFMAHPSPAESAAPSEQLDDFFRKATT